MRQAVVALFVAWLLALAVPAPLDAQATPPFDATVTARSNIRSGPGITFQVVGTAEVGEVVQVARCNADCSWYELADGTWIAAFLIEPAADDSDSTASLKPTAPTTALPLTVVGWNVESGGALQNVVAERLAAFEGVDIWGLSEVNAIDAEAYEFGAEAGEGADFASLLGTTGRADRLLLIWDAERFDLVDSGEMFTVGETGRAPLWAQLRERETGIEFIVMVNHLHRSNAGIRHRQAQALNAWAAEQTLPVIAVGDYNFDYNLPGGVSRDAGFDLMTADGHWEWVQPKELVTTQCSGWPCQYNSILDFVFVAGAAQEWSAQSEIVVMENDFPDDFTTPDHRPVLAVFGLGAGAAVTPTVIVTATVTPTTGVVERAEATAASNANLRDGPGTNYGIVGSVAAGTVLDVTGRNEAGDWYRLASGAWIAAHLVDNAPGGLPITDVPIPTPTPGDCDPSYPDVCIAPPPPDLDCGDIPYTRFRVIGDDPHRIDGDGDGIGCEGESAPVLAEPETHNEPVSVPEAAEPEAVPETPAPDRTGCDPSYPDVCIAPYPPDLDCGDIPYRRFQVQPPDPHRFDGDKDGLGCES